MSSVRSRIARLEERLGTHLPHPRIVVTSGDGCQRVVHVCWSDGIEDRPEALALAELLAQGHDFRACTFVRGVDLDVVLGRKPSMSWGQR